MQDSALAKSLTQLRSVLKSLEEESETLNARITSLEETLIAMNPNMTVWCSDMLRTPGSLRGPGSQLGFTKSDRSGKWGLYVRRGTFERLKQDDGVWRFVQGVPSAEVPLVTAGREERVAAVERFPTLVKELTEAAHQRLALLERANEIRQ